MEEGKEGKKKVMVAIDESEYSQYALQWALDCLKDTIINSELVILNIQDSSNYGYVYASLYGAAPVNLIEMMQENQKKASLALLHRAKETCANYGIVAEILTEFGDPKQAICDTVEKHNIQLLVLGSHSRGAIQRAFLGSVSNYCVHNANCPVLVVKKPL